MQPRLGPVVQAILREIAQPEKFGSFCGIVRKVRYFLFAFGSSGITKMLSIPDVQIWESDVKARLCSRSFESFGSGGRGGEAKLMVPFF